MSRNSELMERFVRLGPVQVEGPNRSYSDRTVAHHLLRIGPFAHRISVSHRLRRAGLTLKAAHTAITELAEFDHTISLIPEDVELDCLATDLARLDVRLQRHVAIAHPGNFLRDVRARHGLSQMQLAVQLGQRLRTVQGWEDGIEVPDPTVLSLVRIFDRDPRIVADAIFEPL